jgi:hypothetical protein
MTSDQILNAIRQLPPTKRIKLTKQLANELEQLTVGRYTIIARFTKNQSKEILSIRTEMFNVITQLYFSPGPRSREWAEVEKDHDLLMEKVDRWVDGIRQALRTAGNATEEFAKIKKKLDDRKRKPTHDTVSIMREVHKARTGKVKTPWRLIFDSLQKRPEFGFANVPNLQRKYRWFKQFQLKLLKQTKMR